MNTAWVLPERSDRYFRHQLAFELAGAGMLAAATGRWDLVGVAGAVLLPAARSTWVHWIRSGPGLVPLAIAMLVAAPHGLHAVVGVWVAGCAIGLLLAKARHARTQSEDPPRPEGPVIRDDASPGGGRAPAGRPQPR